MADAHHTPEQVAKAFAKAPEILAKLKEAGISFPSFELFDDASGVLWLGSKDCITGAQGGIASRLIGSNRQVYRRSGVEGVREIVGLAFCCGLALAAEAEKDHGRDMRQV